jgi:hypothetical protein
LKKDVTSTSWLITNLPSLLLHFKTTWTKEGTAENPWENERTFPEE